MNVSQAHIQNSAPNFQLIKGTTRRRTRRITAKVFLVVFDMYYRVFDWTLIIYFNSCSSADMFYIY